MRRAGPQHGASAVEFTLTLPVMLLVVMGIVELSLLMHRVHLVTRAARDACRLGTGVIEGTEPTGDLIEAAAEEHALTVLATQAVECGSGCDVDATWFENDGWMLLRVVIEVPYVPFSGLMPMLPETTRGSFTMLTQQQVFE
jgi:hypothetical protein